MLDLIRAIIPQNALTYFLLGIISPRQYWIQYHISLIGRIISMEPITITLCLLVFAIVMFVWEECRWQ